MPGLVAGVRKWSGPEIPHLRSHILPKELEGWVEREIAKDDREIRQMTLMLVALFIELWRMLPGAPELEPEVALGWTTPLYDESVAWAASKAGARV